MNAYQAIHSVLADALMNRDTHILGEALELSPATRGLHAINPDRVHLLPAADASLVGVAIGLAMTGARAVMELSGPDALWGVVQQLGQEAAPLRQVGEFVAPVVIRVPLAPTQQAPLDLISGINGLVIGAASTATEAVGLVSGALESLDPVVLFEHREVLCEPVEDLIQPVGFGQARVTREGQDATVITWGTGVSLAHRIADTLVSEGIEIEIVDLRTIQPTDSQTIGNSVHKTGRPILLGCPLSVFDTTIQTAFERLESPPTRIVTTESALITALNQAIDY